MANPQTFGRRIDPRRQPQPARNAPTGLPRQEATCVSDPVIYRNVLQPDNASAPSVDDELREWKRARRHGFNPPWRQLSLMAGLCFGIASFVLPAWVNSAVEWPLYALTAVSFYVWLQKRKKRKTDS